MEFRSVSRGICQTYAVSLSHKIYRRVGVTESLPDGTTWAQVGGSLKMISVGQGPVLWGVDYGDNVWFKEIGIPVLDGL